MQMDLAVGVARDAKRHPVVLLRLQIARRHHARFGHRDADRHILAAASAVGVNENSARNDEENQNHSDDKSASSAHSTVIRRRTISPRWRQRSLISAIQEP